MYKKQIIKIANILAINYQRLSSYGLVSGYLGIALFYFLYSRYIQSETHKKMAENILESIISHKNNKMPRTFSNGLYGLGWTLKYLIKNHYINADDNALKMFDAMASGLYSEVEYQHDQKDDFSTYSKGLYSSLLTKTDLQNRTFKNLELYLNKFDITDMKLSYLISVLYFVLKYETNFKNKSKVYPVKRKLILLINQAIVFNNYTNQDLYILSSFIVKFNINIELQSCKFDLIKDVLMNWQTVVYKDVVSVDYNIDAEYLDKIIAETNPREYPRIISIEKLCSLGINLIMGEMETRQNTDLQ